MIRSLLLLMVALAANPVGAQDWQVVWSDEFDTPGAPDPTKWGYDIGGSGWGNQESQFYTDRTDNARVVDGRLIIEAKEESFGGNDYTSARLVTRGKASWTYGRIEARIKLPQGQGIWPAFWMLPTDSPYGGWPTSGEIDVMEFLGHDTDRVYGTIHYGGGELGHRYTGTNFTLPTGAFPDDYHTFAVEWEPRRMRWFVDGELYQTQVSWSSAGGPYPAPFDQPFHLLLNVAVGGQWPGYPDETTVFPQTMEVDYVRVYQDVEAYPAVSLTDPTGGGPVEAGATLSLQATATDNDGVTAVRFLQDGGVLGTATAEPYTFDVEGVVDGCYALRAQATDTVGYVSVTDPIDVVVGEGCPEGSRSPYLMRLAPVPGSIEAEYYDLGGDGVAYNDFSAANTGDGIRLAEGVDLRPSNDSGGGYDLTDVAAREWVTYSVDVAEAGRYRIVARVAAGVGGRLRMSVDGEDLFGDVDIPSTGGDVRYGNVTLGEADLAAGRHTVRVDMRSAGFSINRFGFVSLGATAQEDGPADDLGLRVAPNPAADRAVVTFVLPQAGTATVRLYDLVGRMVREVGSGTVTAGRVSRTVSLAGLSPGLYSVVVETAAGVEARRLAVVR